MSEGEGLSFTKVVVFMILLMYTVAATLSVGGTIVIGATLSWGKAGGWFPVLAMFYAQFTLLLTVSIMLTEEDIPFSKSWTVDGAKSGKKITGLVECDYDYPDHPQKLTLNGIATRLTRLISRIDGNHGQVEKIRFCNFEQGQGIRFQMPSTPSKSTEQISM